MNVKENIDYFLNTYAKFTCSIASNKEEATRGFTRLIDIIRAHGHDRELLKDVVCGLMDSNHESIHFSSKTLRKVNVYMRTGLNIGIPPDKQIDILDMLDSVDTKRFKVAFEKALYIKKREIERDFKK